MLAICVGGDVRLRVEMSRKKKNHPKNTEGDQRLAYWRKVVARFNTSGLSKDDFCTREGIQRPPSAGGGQS